MKILPLSLVLFFIIFLCITGMLLLKISALEERVAGLPRYTEFGQRFTDIESTLDAVEREAFRTSINHHERLTALETGLGTPTAAGPISVEMLLNSLQADHDAYRNSASKDPDREMGLRGRMEKTIARLEKKQEAGENVVEAVFREIRMSEEPLWKGYLITEIAWKMGPQAVKRLMDFFRNRENSPDLRARAAQSVTIAGGREELKEFALLLKDRTEDLTVKTGLARIFVEHPISAAEEGLIEGVRGIPTEEGKGYDLYHPSYQVACIQALGALDTPRVVRFLELLTDEYCAPDPGKKRDPWVAAHGLHAYHRIMGEEAVVHFEDLMEKYNLFDDPLGQIITALLEPYRKDDKTEKNLPGDGK
jgi:hypothetical protein